MSASTERHRRTRRFALPLRWWVASAFVLVSMSVATLLAFLTWTFAIRFMTGQRDLSVLRQAVANERVIHHSLTGQSGDRRKLLESLAGGSGRTVALWSDGIWVVGGRQINTGDLPAAVLAAGVVLSTVLAFALGWSTSGRTLRQFTRLAVATDRMARGDPQASHPGADDVDLAPLAASFNQTADALVHRGRQDALFAAHVGHELCAPVITLLNAIAVLQTRRHEMPSSGRRAIEDLEAEVRHFDRMVMEIPTITRGDSRRLPHMLARRASRATPGSRLTTRVLTRGHDL